MQLPDSTPIRINDLDFFKGEIDAIHALFTDLGPAIYESPPHPKLLRGETFHVDDKSPKARLSHNVRHVLTGLCTLYDQSSTPHDKPTLGTVHEVLAKRDETLNALQDVNREFGLNTLPRDQLGQLAMKLIDMFRRMENLTNKVKGPATAGLLSKPRGDRGID